MIMKSLLLLCLLALFGAQSHAFGQTRVACVGDSITLGVRSANPYPKQLQEILGDKFAVKNYGLGGRTMIKKGDTSYWKEKALKDAQAFQPSVVVIMLGTNDVRPQNLPHLDEYHGDYKEMVELFKNLPTKPRVFVCLPPPAYPPGHYGIVQENLDKVMATVKQIATEEGVGLIDLHAPLDGKPELSVDHIHPNAEGDTIIAKTVAEAVTNKTSN